MPKLLGHGSPNVIEVLSNLRIRALRKGVWFRALTQQERVLTSLIRRYVKIVNNAMLATVIARIMGKLIYAIKNCFSDLIEGIGRPIAEAWSRSASAMGWKEATTWVKDTHIIRWFGLTAYYSNLNMGIGVRNAR